MGPVAMVAVLATLGGSGTVGEVFESERPEPADAALIAVYVRWYAPMVRLAGLLAGDYRVGEDLAQDAFARLVEAGKVVVDPAAYLRATVVNLSRSRIRRAMIARRYSPRPPSPVAGPAEETDQMAERVAVRQALACLSRRQRQAVVLRYYSQLSEADVAAAMGVSVGSVKTHLHRARVALGRELEGLR